MYRILIFFLCAIGISAAHAQPKDAALFGALPDTNEVVISPNGKKVAFLKSIDGNRLLAISDLIRQDEKPVVIGLGSGKARDVVWADDGYVMLLVSLTRSVETVDGLETLEFYRWMAVNATTGKVETLFGNQAGYYIAEAGALLATLPDEPGKVLMARTFIRSSGRNTASSRITSAVSDKSFYTLFKVNLKNGSTRRIEQGSEHTVDWVVDRDGNVIARIDYDPTAKERRVYSNKDGKLAVTSRFEEQPGEGAVASFIAGTDDPEVVLTARYGSYDKRGLTPFNLATSTFGEPLFRHNTYDLNSVIFDRHQGRVTGVRYTDNIIRAWHIDEADRKLQKSLEKALPGAAPMIVSKSTDGSRMIIKAAYTTQSSEYYVFDKTAKELSFAAAEYENLYGADIAQRSVYAYRSEDGLMIDGYLTKPNDAADKQSLPLIVLPHGGPEGRDDQSFDWWSFFYAANGYAVYQPNFRGSSGYGYNFRQAGFGQWGRKMQDDITKGVEKLIADGVADPDRICIVGASYGGYAALAGATLTPNLYNCAISANGVSDPVAMLGDHSRSGGLSENYWQIRIGGDRFGGGDIEAISPVHNASKAKPPIMLLHGAGDTVVPIAHSRRMADALKKANRPVTFVTLKGEDHWLSGPETRTEMLERSLDFIEEHIGG